MDHADGVDREPLDSLAERSDGARDLVSEDRPRRQPLLPEVEVRAADPVGEDAHEDLSGGGLGCGPLLDSKVSGPVLNDGSHVCVDLMDPRGRDLQVYGTDQLSRTREPGRSVDRRGPIGRESIDDKVQ
jgi:hypothetical protein